MHWLTAYLGMAVLADSYLIMDILDLPGLAVVDRQIDRDKETCIFEAKISEPPLDCCPKCGAAGNLCKSGTRSHTCRDIPLRQYRVVYAHSDILTSAEPRRGQEEKGIGQVLWSLEWANCRITAYQLKWDESARPAEMYRSWPSRKLPG